MSLPFDCTLRSLAADRHPLRRLWAVPGGLLLAAWIAWFGAASVPVTVVSDSARLVTVIPPRLLTAPDDATVVTLDLGLGETVRAGQVVAVLDSEPLRTRLREARSRQAALLAELAALAAQAAAARGGLAEEAQAATAQAGQLSAELRRAEAAAELAARDRQRRQRLRVAGLLSAAEAERAGAEAEQLDAAAAGLRLGRAATSRGRRAAAADRRALLAQTAREEAGLRGELAAAAAEVESLARQLASLRVRAPFAGRLGAQTLLHPGSLVRRGDPLLTLVPSGNSDNVCKVRAELPGAARRALRVGQSARVSLGAAGAAPRTVLAAFVAAIAAAPAAGAEPVVVELVFSAGRRLPTSPSLDGAPCEVEIELARRTPLELVLEALGRTGSRLPSPARP
ncbi:MAG TPA: HlyD family efflux transporter periplasmic adaptor subunit [Thermoanaerobaculia bacterium]|nr:HlyD family efflux transporter periplasmic adaptor subunit [Thermoanaerobaculia bacterium]